MKTDNPNENAHSIKAHFNIWQYLVKLRQDTYTADLAITHSGNTKGDEYGDMYCWK